ADRRDSIAARSATVTAGEKSSRMRSSDRSGRCGAGIEAWIGPKRVPMVSTGRPRAETATEAARMATIGAGIRRETRGHAIRIASDPSVTAIAAGEAVARLAPYADHFATNGPGT